MGSSRLEPSGYAGDKVPAARRGDSPAREHASGSVARTCDAERERVGGWLGIVNRAGRLRGGTERQWRREGSNGYCGSDRHER